MNFRNWLESQGDDLINRITGAHRFDGYISYEGVPERLARQFEPVRRIANAAYKRGKLTIYRTLQVFDPDDVEWDNLGTHWSWRPVPFIDYGGYWKPKGNKAKPVFHAPYEKQKEAKKVVITGEVHPDDVDWEFTAANFQAWNWQYEITLKIKVPVKVIAVNGAPEQISGNSGDGSDNDDYRSYRDEYVNKLFNPVPDEREEERARWRREN